MRIIHIFDTINPPIGNYITVSIELLEGWLASFYYRINTRRTTDWMWIEHLSRWWWASIEITSYLLHVLRSMRNIFSIYLCYIFELHKGSYKRIGVWKQLLFVCSVYTYMVFVLIGIWAYSRQSSCIQLMVITFYTHSKNCILQSLISI